MSNEQRPNIWQDIKAFVRSIAKFNPSCPKCKSLDTIFDYLSVSRKTKYYHCNNCAHDFGKDIKP